MSTPGQPTHGNNPATTIINGHEVHLHDCNDAAHCPADCRQTNWIVVKFDRFVDYDFKQQLKQEHNLEVHDRLDSDDNTYLCKYTPPDLAPVNQLVAVSHLALYPTDAVAAADIETAPPAAENGSQGIHALSDDSGPTVTKLPYIISLHPNPEETPEQILRQLEALGAEHLDDEIVGDTIRVNLDPAVLPQAAAIDDVRAIENVLQHQPFTVRQRSILQFSDQASVASSKYKGKDQSVWVIDTGFDKGFDVRTKDKVHPAFKGRVLAAANSKGATDPADTHGHGTHVAGSVLGSLKAATGKDQTMYGISGSAPEAKLVSIALNFAKFPPVLDVLTQKVEDLGAPLTVNNSWGATWQGRQIPYTTANASIVDAVMWRNPSVCLVFAAGNDGEYVWNSDQKTQQQIGAYGAAKNCITVGASYSDHPVNGPEGYAYQPVDGTVHNTGEPVTFTSTGPTVEGRIKPDIVAPGAVVLSARSQGITPQNLKNTLSFGKPLSDDLLFMSGTSQATPAVTGCVAVLRGAWIQTVAKGDKTKAPTGALLKALLIHGAVDLVGTKFNYVSKLAKFDAGGNIIGTQPIGSTKVITMTAAPNAFQGYGRVDINNSLLPLTTAGAATGAGTLESTQKSVKGQKVKTVTIPRNAKTLTVTLAYTDVPGAALQNIITPYVVLTGPGSTHTPLPPTDPLGRTLVWKPSNVAKIVVPLTLTGPPATTADVYVDVQTAQANAPYALVWSCTV
ncbi:peptidase S8 and S53 [Podospora australis]|uniref:Peptidase S8 and S53 n=1 Tax=Podospora australis TaxID=1536484 RepID=A0AAN7ABQ9_9PEZI|nr:peptidase S8 and S53 [Podospora australis]